MSLESTARYYSTVYISNPNVVGVGFGKKLVSGSLIAEDSIHFFVRKKGRTGSSAFEIPDRVEDTTATGNHGSGEWHLTDVIECGKARPACSGERIRRTFNLRTGTVTLAFAHGTPAQTYVATCCHVSARVDSSATHDLRCSVTIKSKTTSVSSTCSYFKHKPAAGGILDYDIALCRLDAGQPALPERCIPSLKMQPITSIENPLPGQKAQFAGLKSGINACDIVSFILTPFPINYREGQLLVKHLIWGTFPPVETDSGGLLFIKGAALGFAVAAAFNSDKQQEGGLFHPLLPAVRSLLPSFNP